MNWDQIKGKWTEAKGNLQKPWGKLTDDDLTKIDGERNRLLGLLQQKYGVAKEEAEKQLAQFENNCRL